MSPRFQPNTANVTATTPLYPADTYEMVVRAFKPTSKQKEENGQQVEKIGMQARLEVVSPAAFAGKPYFHFGNDLANPDFYRYWKLFLMAVWGYPSTDEGEQAFNEFVLTKDDSFDPENGELGSLYQDALGRRVLANLTQNEYPKGSGKFQNQASFSNVG